MPVRHDTGATVTLSAEQFDKIVELLTPGYQLAQMYLAQAQAAAAEQAPDAPKKPQDDYTG